MPGNGAVRLFQICKIGAFTLLAGLALGGLYLLVGPRTQAPEDAPHPGWNPAREVSGSFVHWFGPGHDETLWYKSDFQYPYSPHPAWKAELIHFREDRLELEIRRERTGEKTVSGAEYQRRGFHHYGRYEVVMKPAPGSGTVSAMFTHTHEQFGDPHDEIDIEFLGNWPRELHLNYFTAGKSAGSIYVPLGFDARKEAHLYAFEWEPGEIRWYVDDRLVHIATPRDHPIPQAPGRLMVHLWSGTPEQYKWHGRPTYEDGARAEVYCLSFRTRGDASAQCSDSFKAKTGD